MIGKESTVGAAASSWRILDDEYCDWSGQLVAMASPRRQAGDRVTRELQPGPFETPGPWCAPAAVRAPSTVCDREQESRVARKQRWRKGCDVTRGGSNGVATDAGPAALPLVRLRSTSSAS